MSVNPAYQFQPGNNMQALRKPRYVFDSLVREIVQNPAKLKAALASVLDQAAGGNLDALDWITCRLEGKAQASINVSDDSKPSVTLIRMIVVQPSDNLNVINELQPAIENNSQAVAVEQEADSTPPLQVIFPDGGGK